MPSVFPWFPLPQSPATSLPQALAFHTREDYCSTFIRPSPPAPSRAPATVIVVDLGGSSIRAGLLGPRPALPSLYFPSIMAARPGSNTEKFFGFDALKPEVAEDLHHCNILASHGL